MHAPIFGFALLRFPQEAPQGLGRRLQMAQLRIPASIPNPLCKFTNSDTPKFSLFLKWGSPLNTCRRISALSRSSSGGNFAPQQTVLSMFRSRHICRMNNSDLTSQLELGRPGEKKEPAKRVSGIFWILLLNIGIYVADHWFLLQEVKGLYLYHALPAWYQFVTATFCHANWNHLSSNLFFLYIFGKLVEEEEGNLALWISYILTGAGANLVSWLVLPRNAISVGASGAVFGLFAISVLVKIRFDWRKILEVLILGQFVIQKVMEAAQASAGLSGNFGRSYALQNVNHIAHLSGALIGVAFVWMISQIPSAPEQDTGISRRKTD